LSATDLDCPKMSSVILDFDHIVVGAGINGTWAAYHLAKRGRKTLLIDQVRNKNKVSVRNDKSNP
jgi:glycerol-3-phosphate dehydrogenase